MSKAMFDVRSLTTPIIGAPMAGGPSTPALAAAVSNAGGLGFLAAGYRSTEQVAEQLQLVRTLTTNPVGVNLFVPQPSLATSESLASYAAELAPDAELLGTTLGSPRPDDDDWDRKIDVFHSLRPDVVSFTFGSPGADTLRRLSDAGIFTVVTVTTLDEARVAVDRGACGLTVQGPAAGGHRATFDPAAEPQSESLSNILRSVVAMTDIPVFAGGGISTAADVARILELGAAAAQIGTALLRADESATNPVHRAALVDPRFTRTASTRAFSGRYARGLCNDFMRRHDESAPFGYPEVNQLTAPLRAAAVAAGDPHGTNLWAGTGFRSARDVSAAEIVASLTA